MKNLFYCALPAILCFLVLYPLCAYSSRDIVKTVEAEGSALVSAEGNEPARDRAINDSMKKAVERILYLFIAEDVAQENIEAIDDTIYSKSRSYIRDYRVLREGTENDFYRVRVRITLSVSEIKDDLERLGLLTDTWGVEEDAPAVVVRVVVHGIEEYSHFRMLKETLETDIQMVNAVHLRKMEWGVAEMDVGMKGSAAGLANALTWREFEDFSLYINDVRADFVGLDMVKE